MRSWKLSLLIISAVTLQGCLSGTAEPEVQEERSTRDIIDLYNQREGVTYLYKSLDKLPSIPLEDDENPDIRGYILQETECLKSESPDLSQCDFKPDGDVKICALDVDDEDPKEDIICISLTENGRVKRAAKKKCKKLLCKLRPGSRSVIFSVVHTKYLKG